jgi:hypothetical protein
MIIVLISFKWVIDTINFANFEVQLFLREMG